ncbi:dienelactone hydrolase family protein [Streptomyces sp. NPDC052309]|uniref:dienelactone hydrolase family protein n=1 Tax=Streptomyces sp. NPDC052309 TaxID=3155421 RepID=UPI00341717D9
MISDTVSVPADHVTLDGDLAVPASARAVVLLPHGVDTVRHNPRSRSIAAQLHTAGFATLLVDLLSEREDEGDTGARRFDAGMLPRRIVAAVDWVKIQPSTRKLPVVLFGAGTQANAVLEAAADLPDRVLTVVLCGARPDPDADAIERVRIPVLFIAGGQEPALLRVTQEAARRLEPPHAVRVVAGATHLFEEPGALDEAVALAGDWCDEQLRSVTRP